MAFRKLADAQEAYDSASRENTAYHTALAAALRVFLDNPDEY